MIWGGVQDSGFQQVMSMLLARGPHWSGEMPGCLAKMHVSSVIE